jgi:hypothetical protein
MFVLCKLNSVCVHDHNMTHYNLSSSHVVALKVFTPTTDFGL